MKKKIIIAVIAITVIISALAICSSAYEYEDYYGTVIESGTELVFKSTPDLTNTVTSHDNLQFYYHKTSGAQIYSSHAINVTSNGKIIYKNDNLGDYDAYYSGVWANAYVKTIQLTQDFTLGNDNISKFIIDNVESGLPEPPPPEDTNIENVLDNAKATFNTSLNVTSVIIAWLMANTLALCGLYLYIMVALIGIAVRFFKK